MFTKFRVRNFKTHLDTEIELKDLTLLIGSNNSGKTNLLKAISFFSDLIKESNKSDDEVYEDYVLEMWGEYFHKSYHDFENLNNKALIELEGEVDLKDVDRYIYSIALKGNIIRNIVSDQVIDEIFAIEMTEKLQFLKGDKVVEEFKNTTPDLYLTKLDLINDDFAEKFIYIYKMRRIIESMGNIMYLNLHPKTLFTATKNEELNRETNFFKLLVESKQSDSEYDKVMSYLRNFEESLIGINVNDDIVKWSFDMGNNNIAVLDSDEVSDGLLKAAAIALICASEHKPSIIMIDEIENGINQHNLVKLIGWLKHVSDNGKNTQFILTSHSPSVIREFSDNLDSVYTVHLKRKKGYVSEVTNLNEALKMINRLGGLKEESVEEVDGVLHIRKYALTELFYDGILGEL